MANTLPLQRPTASNTWYTISQQQWDNAGKSLKQARVHIAEIEETEAGSTQEVPCTWCAKHGYSCRKFTAAAQQGRKVAIFRCSRCLLRRRKCSDDETNSTAPEPEQQMPATKRKRQSRPQEAEAEFSAGNNDDDEDDDSEDETPRAKTHRSTVRSAGNLVSTARLREEVKKYHDDEQSHCVGSKTWSTHQLASMERDDDLKEENRHLKTLIHELKKIVHQQGRRIDELERRAERDDQRAMI